MWEAWQKRDMAAIAKIARSLAMTGVGPGQRYFRSPDAGLPLAHSVVKFLALPGNKGGMKTTTDIHNSGHMHNNEPSQPLDNLYVEQGNADFKGVRKSVWNFSIRRSSTDSSLPIALLRTILYPNYFKKVHTPSRPTEWNPNTSKFADHPFVKRFSVSNWKSNKDNTVNRKEVTSPSLWGGVGGLPPHRKRLPTTTTTTTIKW